MTLYKQLIAGMITVILMLLISVYVIEFNTTRDNLIQQQRSEMNNTINTVGLALAPYLENSDNIAVESVINALFDGSSYSTVKLKFLDTGDEIVRSYSSASTQVPEWFLSLDLFKPIVDQRVVTSGWLQLAEVQITSDPSDAYSQLWVAFERLIIAFLAIMFFALISISLILKRALHPLQLIVNKMEQVAKHQFGEPLPRPNTQDLIYVVDGINSMSIQLEKSFKAQAKEAQQLRERAYIDPVSQLGNRAYFMSQLNSWLGEGGHGGAAILEAGFIRDLYEDKGYEAGDGMVAEFARHLKVSLTSPEVTIARISSEEFGIILPSLDEEEVKIIAESLITYVHDLNADPTGMAQSNLSLGVAFSRTQTSSTELLTMLDNALASAKTDPQINYGFVTGDSDESLMGKQQWRNLVEEAIHNGWVTFRTQAANDGEGNTYHKEVFSSIETGDGKRFTANQYLYALEQLNASHILDQHVIESITKQQKSLEKNVPFAVNISQNSISQPSFIRWVSQFLTKNSALASLIHFEVPENCFINSPHHTALFCNAIRSAGAEFGVDNYGRNFQSLDYLNEFRPAYVKLDYLYTHNLDDENQKFTLTSISRTANNLGIKTIASRVETKDQLNLLSEHFIEVFQGFIVDK